MIERAWASILYWFLSHGDNPLTLSLWIIFCFAIIYIIPGIITLIILTTLDAISAVRGH